MCITINAEELIKARFFLGGIWLLLTDECDFDFNPLNDDSTDIFNCMAPPDSSTAKAQSKQNAFSIGIGSKMFTMLAAGCLWPWCFKLHLEPGKSLVTWGGSNWVADFTLSCKLRVPGHCQWSATLHYTANPAYQTLPNFETVHKAWITLCFHYFVPFHCPVVVSSV